MIYYIKPVPKPRMTQRDKWLTGVKRRPSVRRYFQFKELCRIYKVEVKESETEIVFVLPMPKSWPYKKREEMLGKPHQQRPDKDNLEKALLDAVYDEDCRVWDSRVSKLWGVKPMIAISKIDHGQESLHSALSKKLKREGLSV